MSADKRRRARVQGGWASAPSTRKPVSTSNVANVRSDDDKPKAADGQIQAWLGKVVDKPTTEKKFVYEEPTEEIRQKLPDTIIMKPGVYDISIAPTGVARVRFFPNFIKQEEADQLFDQFQHDISWRQRTVEKNGKSCLQPRLTAWFGDLPYSYSNLTHDSNSEWIPSLRQLKERLEEVTGSQFNSLLANLYRDGHDHLPWHSDDETLLGPQPTIASLSFGDTRNFELRKKPPPENGDYEYTEHVRIPLAHGSLLMMEGAVQEDWQHRIPKEYHDRGPRINLTFRVIYPE